MKKYLIFISLIACVIAGCKLDEDGFKQGTIEGSNSGSNGGLLGTWYVKAMIIYGNISGSYSFTSFTTKDYYLFNSDYSVKVSSTNPDTTFTARYTYAAPTQKLSFGPDPKDNYTITKLTADSLIMNSVSTVSAGSTPTTLTTTVKLARK